MVENNVTLVDTGSPIVNRMSKNCYINPWLFYNITDACGHWLANSE